MKTIMILVLSILPIILSSCASNGGIVNIGVPNNRSLTPRVGGIIPKNGNCSLTPRVGGRIIGYRLKYPCGTPSCTPKSSSYRGHNYNYQQNNGEIRLRYRPVSTRYPMVMR